MLLIDVVGEPAYDFHYRLLGTAIVAFDGIDYRDSMLSQMVPRTDAYHMIWEHHLNAAAGAIELRYDSLRWSRDNSRDHVNYLILFPPLRRNGAAVEVLLRYIHYIMDDTIEDWSMRQATEGSLYVQMRHTTPIRYAAPKPSGCSLNLVGSLPALA